MEDLSLTLNRTGLTVRGILYSPHSHKAPLIAWHGYLDQCQTFAPLAAYLDRPLYAFDFLGQGQSDHLPKGMAYHFIDYVALVEEVVQALKFREYDLLGHSLGAAVATVAAATIAPPPRALIAIEGLGPFPERNSQASFHLTQHLAERRAVKPNRFFASQEEAIAIRQKIGGLTREQARLLVERQLSYHPSAGYSFCYDPRVKIRSGFRYEESQVEDLLQALSCPVLALSKDPMADSFQTLYQSRLQRITHHQHHSIPGGHHLHMEKPKECAKLIEDFLSSLPAQDS